MFVYSHGAFVTFCLLVATTLVVAVDFEDENPFNPIEEDIFCPGTNLPCKTFAFCPLSHIGEREVGQTCQLSDGSPGICCPQSALEDGPIPTGIGEALQLSERQKSKPVLSQNIPDNDIFLEVRTAPEKVKKIQDAEDTLIFKSNEDLGENLGTFSVISLRGTSSFGHSRLFGGEKDSLTLATEAISVAEVSKNLKIRFNLSPLEAGVGLSKFSVLNTGLSSTCPAAPSCNSGSKYRSIDGSCNNLKKPLWGKAKTAFNRIIDAQYGDGIWSERLARDGTRLPSARFVSSRIVSDVSSPRPELSMMVALFGQFIDHDLTSTPTFTLRNGSGIECCSSNGQLLPSTFLHPQCLPIEIPANDPFFSRFGRTCMNFVRSLIVPRPSCDFGFSEQMNEINHWLDGSMIYGNSNQESRKLRALQGGRLKTVVERTGSVLLPVETPGNCASDVCFKAGDKRVNEQPGLTIIHTLFLREHNRIAGSLQRLNPQWTDEQLFQEARRIVGAELQQITYNEWLPNIIGQKFMETYGLYPRKNGYFTGYDEKIDPRINTEFSTAAFRFGHSLLHDIVRTMDAFGRSDQGSELSQYLDEGGRLRSPSYLDSLIRGMIAQPSENVDNAFTPEVTNKLFRGTLPHGMDLVALNTQRGRDHGLPGYNKYRSTCGLPTARSFDDLIGAMPAQTVQALRRIYKDVDDIDLFIGGVCEIAAPGSLLGPIFTCLVGDQFARLRMADRFFFDVGNQPGSFSPEQLRELRKVNLAAILCDNSDGSMSFIQPLPFRLVSNLNPKISCRSQAIPRMNFAPWIGERVPL